MDNGLTIYKNRTWAHTTCSNLPRKQTPLSTINSLGSQPAISQTCRKLNGCF